MPPRIAKPARFAKRPRRRRGPLRPTRRRDFARLALEPLEERVLLIVGMLPVAVLDNADSSNVIGEINPVAEVDYYTFELAKDESGRVTADVTSLASSQLDARLSLYSIGDPSQSSTQPWELLVQSDDQSVDNTNPRIEQHLLPGFYALAVSASPAAGAAANQTGQYRFNVTFDPATPPFDSPGIDGAPHAIVSADFNNDGFLDIATANRDDDDVKVMLGLGDGSFQPLRDPDTGALWAFGVGLNPESMVADYFNDDDFIDLAVANRISGDISILLGNGDGTFHKEDEDVRLAAGAGPQAIVAADFNGDGAVDLATANRGETDTVTILLGDGQGGFRVDQLQVEVGRSPRGITAADFDADGDIDLAIANHGPDNISILINAGETRREGENRFSELRDEGGTPQRFPVANGPWSLVAGHFSGDGDSLLDLAVISDKTTRVTLLFGNGDGTFQSQSQTLLAGQDPEAIGTGDFNGDSRADLAVLNEDTNDVSVFLNNGDGTFGDQVQFSVGDEPQGIVVADFNRDGRDDLAVSNRGNDEVSILLGRGDGAFFGVPRNQVGTDPESIVTVDLNGDGRLDVVTANRVSDDVTVLLGLGNGTFEGGMSFPVGMGPWDVAVADLNGDERLDLVTVNHFSDDVSILLGLGDGTFRAALRFDLRTQSVTQCASCAVEPVALVIVDFDGDGNLDLATRNQFADNFAVLLGHGDGTFSDLQYYAKDQAPFDLATRFDDPAVETGAAQSGRFVPHSILLDDFNGDGDLDLVVSNDFAAEVVIRLGDGSGGFGPERRFRTTADAEFLTSGDFNNDQKQDLAIVHDAEEVITVLLGRGDGTFFREYKKAGKPLEFDVGNGPRSPATADFDGDGNLDLIVINDNDDTVSVLLGNGDGTFQDQQIFKNGSETAGEEGFGIAGERLVVLHLNDDNGDGNIDDDDLPDVVVINKQSNDLTIFMGNKTPGEPWGFETSHLQVSGLVRPEHMTAVDIDGDGLLDLVMVNDFSTDVNVPDVVVLLNAGTDGFRTEVLTYDLDPDSRFSRDVVAGDFDGDGVVDLAIIDKFQDEVSFLFGGRNELGKWDKTFSDPVRVPTGDSPWRTAAGDINHDGMADLVVTNRPDKSTTVLFGDGNRAFSERFTLQDGEAKQSTADADIDGDKRIDLVTATVSDDVAIVLDVEADGSFERLPVVPDRLGSAPLLADFDGDGMTDSLVIDRNGELFLRMGEESTVFGKRQKLDLSLVRDIVTFRSAAGLTGVVVSHRGSSELSVLSNQGRVGDAWQGFKKTVMSLGNANPSRLAAADVDNDGRDDLVIIDASASKVFIYRGDDDDTFALQSSIDVGLGPSDVELVDVDGDGHVDLVVTSWNSAQVDVLLNDGTGRFTRTTRMRASGGLSAIDSAQRVVLSRGETSALAHGDFNNDGLADLVVANAGESSFAVLFGKGAGQFVDPLRVFNGNGPTAVVSGRFDGDDHLDVALLNKGDGTIAIYLGDGSGGFEVRSVLSIGNSPVDFVVHQVNNDGIDDLIVSNQFGDLITVVSTSGGFVAETRFGLFPFPYVETAPLAIADLNGDGVADVVMGNSDLDRLRIQFAGDGGGFERLFDRQRGATDATLLAPTTIDLVDVTGDGRSDLIVTNAVTRQVLVYRDTVSQLVDSSGKTTALHDFVLLDGFDFSNLLPVDSTLLPIDTTTADVDADGDVDIIVALKNSSADVSAGGVSIFLNPGNTINPWQMMAGPEIAGQPVSIDAVDQNDDGIADLLVTDEAGFATLYLGDGDGSFDDRPAMMISLGGSLDDDRLLLHGSQAFGVLRDATGQTMVRFDLADFVHGVQATARRVLAVGIDDIWSMKTLDFDGNGTPELIVAGFNALGEQVAALLVEVVQGRFVVDREWSMATIDDRSELALLPLGDGDFRIIAAEPGKVTPTIVGRRGSAELNSVGFLPVSFPSPDTFTASGASNTTPGAGLLNLLSDVFFSIDSDSEGSDNSFMGLIERAFRTVYDALAAAYEAVDGLALGGLDVGIGLVTEVAKSAIPGARAVEFLMERLFEEETSPGDQELIARGARPDEGGLVARAVEKVFEQQGWLDVLAKMVTSAAQDPEVVAKAIAQPRGKAEEPSEAVDPPLVQDAPPKVDDDKRFDLFGDLFAFFAPAPRPARIAGKKMDSPNGSQSGDDNLFYERDDSLNTSQIIGATLIAAGVAGLAASGGLALRKYRRNRASH